MSVQLEQSYIDFFSNLQKIKTSLTQTQSQLLVDSSLQVVNKLGISWRMLCLARPFYALFGKDVYSHVRADLVAKNILRYCEANQEYFGIQSKACLELQLAILTALHVKTASKYGQLFEKAIGDIKSRLTPNPEIRVWPKSLADIGITQTQKTQTEYTLAQVVPLLRKDSALVVRSIVETYFASGILRKAKKTLLLRLSALSRHPELVKVFDEPVRFTCVYDASRVITNIVLHAKKIVGKGGERVVKQSYDLTTGSCLARKKCMSTTEEWLVRYIKEHNVQGLAQVFSIRKVDKALGAVKTQVLEKLYSGNLVSLFGTHMAIDQKHILFENLLLGLKNLHSIVVPEVRFKVENSVYRFLNVRAFHYDISPNNVFVIKPPETDVWEAVIGDFGFACDITIAGGTLGYRPPEAIIAEMQQPAACDRQQNMMLAMDYGQKKDIWAMGLVLASLLAGHFSQKVGGIIPPLPALEACFLFSPTTDARIAGLQQHSIDCDIAAFKAVSDNLLYNKLWDIVALMLRVNPDERMNAQAIYARFEEVKPRFGS